MKKLTLNNQFAATVAYLCRLVSVVALMLFALSPPAQADLNYADKPLFWATGVQPNVALMIDTSGSMDNGGGFDAGPVSAGTSVCDGSAIAASSNISRMQAAREAACQIVKDNSTSMRIGLYRFNDAGTSGLFVQNFGSTAAVLNGSIAGFTGDNGTPLTNTVKTIVNTYTGNSSPIQYRCQKNYTVFFTDGAPSTGNDKNSTLTLPALSTIQSTKWKNGLGTSGNGDISPAWDGFLDPTFKSPGCGGCDVYPWLDDIAQFAYDVDMRTVDSTTLAATCGGTAPATGKDCAGKDWDGGDDIGDNKTAYAKQNVVTFTVGFGAEAHNELMLDTPLLNKIKITPSMVNLVDNPATPLINEASSITVTAHGLKTGDYVHYYAADPTSGTIVGTADTSTETVTGDTTLMATGDKLTYSNAGGASLQYGVVTDTTPTCGDIGGLSSGNSYRITDSSANNFQLKNTGSNSTINLTGKGATGTLHSFSRAAVTANAQTTAGLNTSGSSPISSYWDRVTISSHGFIDDDYVIYTCSSGSSSDCIGGLSPGAGYFIKYDTSDRFKLAATAGGSTINISRPSNGGSTATFTRAGTSANSITVTADSSSNTPVNTGTEVITKASHGFSDDDLVTYSCASGAASSTTTPTAATTYYAVLTSAAGNPGTFKLALSPADAAATPTPITVDIVNAGNSAQTFTYLGGTVAPTIGNLYAYKTDALADDTPNPAGEDSAKGKYYVDVLDADTIKLRQCGNVAGCTTPAASTVTFSSTGSGILSTGPGKSYFAASAAQLSDALTAAFTVIRADILSSASLGGTGSTTLNTSSNIYQATYSTGDWSGEVQSFLVSEILQGNTIPAWKASSKIPAPSLRNIYTWNGAAGVVFPSGTTTGLTSTQKDSVQTASVVDWVRGTDGALRGRNNGVLGDIINSSPRAVGVPNGTYDTTLSGTEASSYATFKGTYSTRPTTVYAGSNDGMLHAFSDTNGVEQFAFIPDGVYIDWLESDNDGLLGGATPIQKFNLLAQKGYGQGSAAHLYFVDGSPNSGDAYWGGAWHTVLVGGLGRGGRSVYALDITDPSGFNASKVLWEFNGGGNMGYSYSQPQIARVPDGSGKWAAIFGNGYDSAGDIARLFIVDIKDGSIIRQFDLGSAYGVTGLNGLSTPAVKVDSTGTATAIYAGDLLGNIWKFDLSASTTPSVWTAEKLFTATDTTNKVQPITGPVTLGTNPAGSAASGTDTMVYFGTGSYMTTGDKSYVPATLKNDTLYGLWDNKTGVINKGNLVEQTQTLVSGLIIQTQLTVNYTTAPVNRGWYVDLVQDSNYLGERIVNRPVLVGTRLIATTVIPSNTDPCSGGGTSNFLEMNALTGAMFSTAVLDTNGDGVIDGNDVAAAGMQSVNGVYGQPSVIETPGNPNYTDIKLVNASNGIIEQITNREPTDGNAVLNSGRMSWRQLQ